MKAPEPRATPAIPAAKSRLGYACIYWLLVRPALWQGFDRVRVQQVGPLPHPADGPLICYLNHPSWWDLYMCALVDRHVLGGRFETYGMMEEAQLRAYGLFRWAGAFSVHRSDRAEAARSLAYASALLRERPGRALYIFPQGTLTPNDQRPLRLYSGLARMVQQIGPVVLCPITFRYEFRREQRPEAFVRLGPLHQAAPSSERGAVRALSNELTTRLTESADTLRAFVVADNMRAFRVALRGQPSFNHLIDQIHRLLPWR